MVSMAEHGKGWAGLGVVRGLMLLGNLFACMVYIK